MNNKFLICTTVRPCWTEFEDFPSTAVPSVPTFIRVCTRYAPTPCCVWVCVFVVLSLDPKWPLSWVSFLMHLSLFALLSLCFSLSSKCLSFSPLAYPVKSHPPTCLALPNIFGSSHVWVLSWMPCIPIKYKRTRKSADDGRHITAPETRHPFHLFLLNREAHY